MGALEADITDPITRPLHILDRPEDAAVLAPTIEQGSFIAPFQGPFGAVVTNLINDPNLAQIDRATRWPRDNYRKPFRVDELAVLVEMSVASVHSHFKAITYSRSSGRPIPGYAVGGRITDPHDMRKTSSCSTRES
ncbi:hypothetical protein PUN4_180067 [Paraburkholderia unamae]|uniref:hypothetical protein n=1 Tax=Paraburkholderia unamae TaxID=219649 RepID=UPI001CAF746B|nr:hypothetical protein [Paraburkholderia unamae]CAG9252014.1 hypothetical protein PUN4_180067 [Paraburkholderia unamae]